MSEITSYYWDNVVTPSVVKIEPVEGENKANVVVEPLQSGFGITLGNVMRRVLISSLCGAAVESVEIEGVVHEYSSIQGVREDVGDIILNLKQIVFKIDDAKEKELYLRVEDPGEVTAGMIVCGDGIDVVNKDLVICTLSQKTTFNMKLYVNFGSGYVQAKKSKKNSMMMINRIHLDALYSPVKRVNPIVESIRVGDITNYDKLTLEVETDGSISVDKAVELSAKILQKQFSSFIHFNEADVLQGAGSSDHVAHKKCNPRFLCKVYDLELSVRSHNCLNRAQIVYIGDLVTKTEQEMLKTANFGKKSLHEIRLLLKSMELSFGVEIENWLAIRQEEEEKNMKKEKKRIGYEA